MDRGIEAVRQWAINDGNPNPAFRVSDDGAVTNYTFQFHNESACYYGAIDVYPENQLVLNLSPDSVIPEKRRDPVARLLAEINHTHLVIGNFEMGCADGRIRLRYGLDIDKKHVCAEFIERMVAGLSTTMLRYWPAIGACAFQNCSPLAALSPKARMCRDVKAELPPEDEALAYFGEVNVLRRWAARIREAIASEEPLSEDAWELIGHAAIIEFEHVSLGEQLARRIADDCGLALTILTENDLANSGLNLSLFEQHAPTMLYLAHGEWQKLPSKEQPEEANAAHTRVKALLQGFTGEHPLICVSVCSDLGELDPALLRVETFSRQFVMPEESLKQMGEAMIAMIGEKDCAQSITSHVEKVGQLIRWEYRAMEQRQLAAMRLRRLRAEEDRPIELIDLVRLTSNGLAESDTSTHEDGELKRSIAIHEAGHATLAVIDSGGKDVPEYSSVVPSVRHRGIVLDSLSYAFAHDQRYTYRDLQHDIRVSLGGRAAEELVFGRLGISTGCRRDLENSSKQAARAFAFWGFSPAMEHAESSADNLAVITLPTTISEDQHLEGMVRQFLRQQYDVALEMLSAHKPLMLDIADRLEKNAVLDQGELSQIVARYEAGVKKGGEQPRNGVASSMKSMATTVD